MGASLRSMPGSNPLLDGQIIEPQTWLDRLSLALSLPGASPEDAVASRWGESCQRGRFNFPAVKGPFASSVKCPSASWARDGSPWGRDHRAI